MSDNRRRYRATKNAMKQLCPTELKGNNARHLQTLAALISGIVGSKRTDLPAVAGQVLDGTKRESRVKKYYRWLSNESIGVELLNQVHSLVPQGCTVIVTGTANGSVLKLSFLTRKAVAFISTRGVSLTRCGFRV